MKPSAAPGSGRWRLLLLGALIVGLLVTARALRLDERVTLDGLRRAASEPGGRALFVGAFVLGELLHVPGLIFVGAGVLAWGRLDGGLFGFAAAILAVSASFLVTRLVGGQPLGGIERPWIKRVLAGLDRRPVLTIAVLRTVLIMSPPLNVALALTGVRFRDYVLGSALGLIPPVTVAVLCVDAVAG